MNNEERMKEILDELGIELYIDGCGCCDSPWVTFRYKGEEIIDKDNFKFNNLIKKTMEVE